jgi:hypothetical protein
MDLAGLLAEIQDAFQQPISAGLAQIEPMMIGLWTALGAGIISYHALRAGTGMGGAGTVQAALSVILNLMLAQAALHWTPQLADWSANTASQLAGLGGGTSTATPVGIAGTGGELMGRALDHASSQTGFLGLEFWNYPQAISIILAGVIILGAYLWMALVSLSAWVEFFLGVLIMSPLFCFMGTPGFGSAAFHPAALMMSSTFRIAGIGIIASLAQAFVETNVLPEGNASMTITDCLLAGGTAVCVFFVSLQASRLVSHVMLGSGVGWNGAGAAWGATVGLASSVFGGGTSGASAAVAGGAGGTGGSSRGNTGGGSVSGGSTTVGRRSTPVRP